MSAKRKEKRCSGIRNVEKENKIRKKDSLASLKLSVSSAFTPLISIYSCESEQWGYVGSPIDRKIKITNRIWPILKSRLASYDHGPMFFRERSSLRRGTPALSLSTCHNHTLYNTSASVLTRKLILLSTFRESLHRHHARSNARCPF